MFSTDLTLQLLFNWVSVLLKIRWTCSVSFWDFHWTASFLWGTMRQKTRHRLALMRWYFVHWDIWSSMEKTSSSTCRPTNCWNKTCVIKAKNRLYMKSYLLLYSVSMKMIHNMYSYLAKNLWIIPTDFYTAAYSVYYYQMLFHYSLFSQLNTLLKVSYFLVFYSIFFYQFKSISLIHFPSQITCLQSQTTDQCQW